MGVPRAGAARIGRRLAEGGLGSSNFPSEAVSSVVMLPAMALLVPTLARGSRHRARARARIRELGGGLAAQHLGADEGECEEHDDSGMPVHVRDRAPK